MGRPSTAQAERARQLLAREGASDGSSAAACAEAAGRVYDKLDAHLSPLLGRAGVQTLFARSAKLARAELPPLAATPDSSTNLRACLQALEPAAATETAAVVLGTFFELVTTFIGERLTVQVLRNAWPGIEDTGPTETPI